MSTFACPAKFTAGTDGRILVEFVDLPRVAPDGKDEREAFAEAMDALGSDLSIAFPGAKRSGRHRRPSATSAWRQYRSCSRRN